MSSSDSRPRWKQCSDSELRDQIEELKAMQEGGYLRYASEDGKPRNTTTRRDQRREETQKDR